MIQTGVLVWAALALKTLSPVMSHWPPLLTTVAGWPPLSNWPSFQVTVPWLIRLSVFRNLLAAVLNCN